MKNEAWELCCCSFMASGGQIWRTLGKRILYGLFICQHVGSYVWFLCLTVWDNIQFSFKEVLLIFCWWNHGDLKWLEGKLYTIESQHFLPRLFCGSCIYSVSTTIGGLDFELNAPEHDGTFSPNALNSYTIKGFFVGDRWEGSDGLKVSKGLPAFPMTSQPVSTVEYRDIWWHMWRSLNYYFLQALPSLGRNKSSFKKTIPTLEHKECP